MSFRPIDNERNGPLEKAHVSVDSNRYDETECGAAGRQKGQITHELHPQHIMNQYRIYRRQLMPEPLLVAHYTWRRYHRSSLALRKWLVYVDQGALNFPSFPHCILLCIRFEIFILNFLAAPHLFRYYFVWELLLEVNSTCFLVQSLHYHCPDGLRVFVYTILIWAMHEEFPSAK